MTPALHQMLNALYMLAAAVITAATPFFVRKVLALMGETQKRVKNQRYADALQIVEGVAANIVLKLASRVRDAKDPTKPGTWDAAVAHDFARIALAELKATGGEALAVISEQAPRGVDNVLRTMLEAQVEKLRRDQPFMMTSAVATLRTTEDEE